jgi:hypothetical protein
MCWLQRCWPTGCRGGVPPRRGLAVRSAGADACRAHSGPEPALAYCGDVDGGLGWCRAALRGDHRHAPPGGLRRRHDARHPARGAHHRRHQLPALRADTAPGLRGGSRGRAALCRSFGRNPWNGTTLAGVLGARLRRSVGGDRRCVPRTRGFDRQRFAWADFVSSGGGARRGRGPGGGCGPVGLGAGRAGASGSRAGGAGIPGARGRRR